MYVIGHRGAPYEAPENTLASYEKALAHKLNSVECDVHLSKDNELIVIHDSTLDRTINASGFVKDYTLAELRLFDVKGGGKISTLQEIYDFVSRTTGQIDQRNARPVVLEHTKNSISMNPSVKYTDGILSVKEKAVLCIELKVQGLEQKILDFAKQNNAEKNLVIISFFHQMLRNIKTANPKLTTGVLFACEPIYSSELGKSALADYILPEKDFCTRQMVEEAHSNALKVFPWVVDNKSEAELLLSYGVDGIVTNDVRRIS